jgi:hypothetical protein
MIEPEQTGPPELRPMHHDPRLGVLTVSVSIEPSGKLSLHGPSNLLLCETILLDGLNFIVNKKIEEQAEEHRKNIIVAPEAALSRLRGGNGQGRKP